MILENKLYLKDVKEIAESKNINFSKFKNKKILLTGATGLIGSFLTDVLMYRNLKFNDNIKLYVVSRNENKILERFKKYNPVSYPANNNDLIYIIGDISKPLNMTDDFDYIIHGASNTHPVAYSTDPISTITTNVFGLYNLLEYSKKNKKCRVFLTSSVEIYGETDKETLYENDLGYINCNTLRAGYSESKRLCESMVQAYISKYDMDIVIGRLCRIYGPTMQKEDSKALSQFIKKAVNNENIVLKSNGEQFYSYCYMADAVSAILKIITDGTVGEAYNVSYEKSDVKLKDIAKILSEIVNTKVVFEMPDEVEKKGYSTATRAIINSNKLNKLGWVAHNDINTGLNKTVSILKGISTK